jgi:hypothetical protein
MTEKERKLDKLSKNYQELDKDGKNRLLRIGEKVLNVKTFVDKETSSLDKEELKIEES